MRNIQGYVKMSVHRNAMCTTQKWASPFIYIILYKLCDQRNAQYILMRRFRQWDLGISVSICILRKFLCAQIIGKGRYKKKCGFCLQRTSRLCGEYTEKEVEYADKTWVTTSNTVFTMSSQCVHQWNYNYQCTMLHYNINDTVLFHTIFCSHIFLPIFLLIPNKR